MADSDPARERSFSALPQPEHPETPPAEPQARRGFLTEGAVGVFFLSLLAAVLGGVIAVYWPSLLGQQDSASGDRIAALETRVDQLSAGQAPKAAAATFNDLRKDVSALADRVDADEARISMLEKSAGETGTVDSSTLKSGADVAPIIARIQRLEQEARSEPLRLDADDKTLKDLGARTQALNDTLGKMDVRVAQLEKTAPPADLPQQLSSFASKSDSAALSARMTRIESTNSTEVMKRAASVLALANLMRVSQEGRPFADELVALKALQPQSDEVADLARYAKKGVATPAALADRLSREADAILAAERDAKAKNWMQRFLANLSNLVSVRRVGNVPGSSTQSRLARGEAAAKSGDLARAVMEMKGLSGPALSAAKPWIDAAEARLAADRDTASLSQKMIASLAAPLPQPAPGRLP
jgi:uroporphyrinogen-III synthase